MPGHLKQSVPQFNKTMDTTLLIAIAPLVLIIVGLEIFALVDLYRRDKRLVQGENKWLWAAIIIIFSTIGTIAYLTVGRQDRSFE